MSRQTCRVGCFDAIEGVLIAGIPWEGGVRSAKTGFLVGYGRVLLHFTGLVVFFIVKSSVTKKGKENWNGKGLY